MDFSGGRGRHFDTLLFHLMRGNKHLIARRLFCLSILQLTIVERVVLYIQVWYIVVLAISSLGYFFVSFVA